MASYFEKTKVKLDLLTNINMLLIVEKGIRGGIYYYAHMHIYMQNLITNTKKIMIKIKNRHILNIGM